MWLAIIVLGGILQGAFALPMKYTTRWSWANTWGMWSVWTLIVVPWSIGLLTIPNLFKIYTEVAPAALGTVFLLGFIWGISAISVGKGLDYLGLGMGFSLIMGLVLTVGSLLPLVTRQTVSHSGSIVFTLIVGIIVMLAGICVSGWSAVLRQNYSRQNSGTFDVAGSKYLVKGLIMCVIAGATAPMLNYAFIYGDPIRAAAERLGVIRTLAPNGIWCIALSGGFLVNATYCIWRIVGEKTLSQYRLAGTGPYFLFTFIMAFMWAGGVVLYGMGTSNLGSLGPSIGWALFFGVAIAVANLLGFLKGEWRDSGQKARIVAMAGLLILISGIALVGWANSLKMHT
jgi:L-rhamnose-H+ transport protein